MAHRQASGASQDGAINVADQVLARGGRIELVLDEADRAPEEGPTYFVGGGVEFEPGLVGEPGRPGYQLNAMCGSR
jgi:hypothetical protein